MIKKWTVLVILGLAIGFSLIYYVIHSEIASPHVEIVVFGEDSSNLQAYESLKEDFLAATGITAKFQRATFEQAVQKADAVFRSGSGDYDIVLQYNFSLAPYVRNHYVVEIGDIFSPAILNNRQINEGMFDNALRETSFYYSNPQDPSSPPKQFGFPFAANTMILVYNKDLFDDPALKQEYRRRKGKDLVPPTDWAAYLDLAEFFSNARTGLKGVCMQGAGDGWLYYELSNYLFSIGAGTSTKRYGWQEDADSTIADPRNEEALKYMKRLHDFSSGDFFTVGASQQQEIMLAGNTAMSIMWSDYLLPLAKSTKPHFGFAPIPGKVSGLAGGAFYINRKSRHMEPASQFVLFALRPENQAKLVNRGLCSPLRTAYTPDVLQHVPYAQALYDSLDRGIFMFEADSDAEIVNTALTTAVQKFVRGQITAADALKQAQNEVLAKRSRIVK